MAKKNSSTKTVDSSSSVTSVEVTDVGLTPAQKQARLRELYAQFKDHQKALEEMQGKESEILRQMLEECGDENGKLALKVGTETFIVSRRGNKHFLKSPRSTSNIVSV